MISFHKLLIATAIVFCCGFALWTFGHYLALHQPGMLVLTVVFVMLAAGLSYYLRHLKRFLGR